MLTIESVVSEVLPSFSNTVLYSQDRDYEHTVTFSGIDSLSSFSFEVFLVNEDDFIRIPQIVIGQTNTSCTFITTYETVENTKAKYLEVKVIYNNVITDYGRINISLRKLKVITESFKSNVGTIPLLSSNLLYPRIRLGFQRWSTVEKNDITTTSKLLEPLFTPLYDSYFKTIKYSSKAKFKESYKNIKGIYTGSRPVDVVKNGDTLMYNATSIERYPTKTTAVVTPKSLQLVSMLIEVGHEYNYGYLSNQLLYIKRSTREGSDSLYKVVIKGFDKYGNNLSEVVLVTPNFFTMSTKRYNTITSITSSVPVFVNNYVDCRYDHYIIKDHFTPPPIVDKNLFQFTPLALFVYNEDRSRKTLQLFNIDKTYSQYSHKFDFDCNHSQDISLFIDEYLRVVWKDTSTLYSSCLGHDLSKDVGNHPSVNNNPIIQVKDQNTSIGDWIEATIDLTQWEENKPMLISIKNKDTTLYYDHNTDSFVSNTTFFYPASKNSLELSVRVTNEEPYVFTVRSDDLKSKYVATSYSHKLHSYSTSSSTGSLYHIDGKLRTLTINDEKTTQLNTTYSDKLRIIVQPTNVSEYEWSLNINGHIISSTGSTLPISLYKLISDNGNQNTDVIIDLDRYNLLRFMNTSEATIKLTTTSEDSYGYVSDNNFKVICNDSKGTEELAKLGQDTNTFNITFTDSTKRIT